MALGAWFSEPTNKALGSLRLQVAFSVWLNKLFELVVNFLTFLQPLEAKWTTY